MPWNGDRDLLYRLYYGGLQAERALPSEPINPMYPLYDEVELPKTYKSSDGAKSAAISGEIVAV